MNNHDEIFRKFPNKFVVIRNEEVIDSGDSFDEAFSGAINAGLTIGNFLIQECTEGDSAYTQFFSSRVVFA